LLALGYSEAISSSFASEAESERFASGRGVVALENPLSEEARLLRPSLAPGMLAMLGHNLNRDVREVRLFEQGAVFGGTADEVVEQESLALGLTGELPATALCGAKDAGIYELKGVVESLLGLFASRAAYVAKKLLGEPSLLNESLASEVIFSAETPAWIEAGRGATALLADKPVAVFGELAAQEREARKLRQAVYVAEVDLDALYALPLRRATAKELSRYQAVERDFSFTFTDAVEWGTIAHAVEELGIAELVRLKPVEIFRDGKTVAAGHYALLLRCVFQSQERTLREDELVGWSARVIERLTVLGGTMRM
jgi:phenylalanyl-tRNA synthetase beta chain